MEFQLPQGTRIFLPIKPELLDKSLGEMIYALQTDNIFFLTKGKLIVRMVFHQIASEEPSPDEMITYHCEGNEVSRKRERAEDTDSGSEGSNDAGKTVHIYYRTFY